jgi:hypothetical protein
MAAYYLNEQAINAVMAGRSIRTTASLARALAMPRTTVWRILVGKAPVTAEFMAATRVAFPEIDPNYLFSIR